MPHRHQLAMVDAKQGNERPSPYMYTLYVYLICMPYMYALYVCITGISSAWSTLSKEMSALHQLDSINPKYAHAQVCNPCTPATPATPATLHTPHTLHTLHTLPPMPYTLHPMPYVSCHTTSSSIMLELGSINPSCARIHPLSVTRHE